MAAEALTACPRDSFRPRSLLTPATVPHMLGILRHLSDKQRELLLARVPDDVAALLRSEWQLPAAAAAAAGGGGGGDPSGGGESGGGRGWVHTIRRLPRPTWLSQLHACQRSLPKSTPLA